MISAADSSAVNISVVLGKQRLVLRKFSNKETEIKVLQKYFLDKTNATIKDTMTLTGYSLSPLILLYFKAYLFSLYFSMLFAS